MRGATGATLTPRCPKRAPWIRSMRTMSSASPGRRCSAEVFGGMTDDDIAAIYTYLTTLAPVAHRVTNAESEPLTFCKMCRQLHGYGNQNDSQPRHRSHAN